MKLQKRQSSRGSLSNRAGRNPLIQYAGLLSYIILLAMRIPLSKVIGDAGIGLFAPAFEIFFLIALFTSYSMTGAMSGIIRYRVKREQHRNAKQVFHAALFTNLLVSAVLAALLVVFSAFVADILVLESLSRMAVIATAPVLVLAAFIGIFRGYFNGYGLGMLTAHSQYLEGIAMMACAMFGANALYDYGVKVAALKQNVAYSYAYGALGAMLGVMLSQVITMLYLLIIYIIYAGAMRGRLDMDSGKRAEPKFSAQRTLLAGSFPIALVSVFSNLFMLVDQRMFNYCMNKKEMGESRTALWGGYYSKFAVLIGIGSALGVLSIYSMAGRISNAYDREEYRAMRERLGKTVKKLCIVVCPIAVYLAALAHAVIACLYTGKNDTVVAWVQKGAVLIVLYGFCFLFGHLLYRMHMLKELFLSTIISVFAHVLMAYLFVQKAYLGADGIIYALIIFFALYGGLNFYFLSRNLKYRQDWFSGVIFPAAAAIVSGVAVMLAERFLLEPVGAVLTIVIGIVAGLFFYITFLMVLRVIGEAELSKMPLGFFFIMFGKNIGVL